MSGLTRYVRSTLVMLITLALVLAIMAPVTAQEGDTPAGEPPPTTLTEETATGASGDGFTGVVADAATLNVRSGPGQQFPAFTTIPLGQSVELLGRDRVGAWLQARLSDGRVGWISSQFVLSDFMLVNLPVVDETPQTVAVTAPVVTWTGDTAVGAPLRSFGNLIVRTGPGLNFPVLVTLPVDQTFVLQGRTADGAWLQVRVPDGRLGWVARTVITTTLDLATLPTVTTEAVVEAPPATEALAPGVGGLAQGTVVDATNLNVRTGPGLEFTIMAPLPLGSNVVLEGRNADGAWLQVRLADGRLGWVSSTFMTANLDIANLPVVDETPVTVTAPPSPAVGLSAVGATLRSFGDLIVRTGPGLNFPVLVTLPVDQTFVLQGRTADGAWLQVRVPDGRLGWVARTVITTTLDLVTLPTATTEAVVEAPPPTEALAPGVGGLAQGTVVNAMNLNVRTGPGLEFTIMSMLPLGSNVVLEGRNVDGAWLQVRLADGRLGWVSSTFMTANLDIANLPVTAPETPAVEAALPVAEAPAVGGLALGTVVEVPLLNVRSGPGLEFGAFTALPLGESVVLEGRDLNGFWLQIRLADGRLGWVSSAYMTANLDIANLPVTG